jgi:glutathione synthase/RimK-type ligase-like ATP-grasp enzyme
MHVGLVTCGALPGLHSDDRHLLVALREAGIDAQPVVWEDPHQDWSEFNLCVIRSAWDYCWRRPDFLRWAELAAARTTLWNSDRLVRWNTHKEYLCDLASHDVPTVPTEVLRTGSHVVMRDAAQKRGWNDIVLKAAVAQSGRYAMRATAPDWPAAQAHLDRLLPHEDMLLQPFVPSVPEQGELSLVFIESEFTHAVRKRAATGDFRVHDDHGGSVTPEAPSEAHLDVARRALAATGEPTLYARVDLVEDDTGELVVMEYEVIEPELFFRFSREAVARFVDGVKRRLEA